MIDQDKMRALAARLREDYDFSLSITSTRYRDAVSRTPIEAADAIDPLAYKSMAGAKIIDPIHRAVTERCSGSTAIQVVELDGGRAL